MLNLTVPVSLNISQSGLSQTARADKRKKKMSAIASLTFRELAEKMSLRAAEGTVCSSNLSNLHSALKAFLRDSGLSEDCVIGSIMRVSYYRNLAKHVEVLKAQGRTAAYISNRKSLLGKWSSLLNQLDRLEALTNDTNTPFQLALQDILKQANTTPTQLAKMLGINKQTFHRWLKGSQPRQSALPALRRIEAFFALERNALVTLAFEFNYYKPADESPSTKIEYRERLAAFCKDHYRLKTISEQLAREWAELMVHKTEKLPLLKRQARGAWVTTEYITKGKTERNRHLFVKDKYVPTSKVVWTSLTAYLGWMCREISLGGGGLGVGDVQSLAWLTHKSMIHRYLKWKLERANDKVHYGILEFVKQVKALTHPVHGYLTQMPVLNEHLPEHARHKSWEEGCNEAFEWANAMKRNLGTENIEHSRLSFPRFFVCQRMGFMLPVFPDAAL